MKGEPPSSSCARLRFRSLACGNFLLGVLLVGEESGWFDSVFLPFDRVRSWGGDIFLDVRFYEGKVAVLKIAALKTTGQPLPGLNLLYVGKSIERDRVDDQTWRVNKWMNKCMNVWIEMNGKLDALMNALKFGLEHDSTYHPHI